MCLEQAPYKRLKLPGAIVRGEAVRMVRHVLIMLLLLSSGVAAQDSSSGPAPTPRPRSKWSGAPLACLRKPRAT